MQAEAELDEMERLFGQRCESRFQATVLKEELRHCFSREKYSEMVERARNYIREGDIFQVVLSDPLEARAQGSLFDTSTVCCAQQTRLLYVLLFQR